MSNINESFSIGSRQVGKTQGRVEVAHKKAQLIELACDLCVEGKIEREHYYRLKYLIKSSDPENQVLAEKILLRDKETEE